MRKLLPWLLLICALRLAHAADWHGPAEVEINLPEAPLDISQCSVSCEGRRLSLGVDYRLDALSGRLLLLDASLLGRRLDVRYERLRIDLPQEFSLMPRESLPWIVEGESGDSLVLAGLPDRVEEIPSRLQYTGSFLRGVRVGNNGELGMESGLQLQVQGQIGPDVEVEAYLSDRNTPIQPEGSSRNLEEVDRIHVKVQSPRWQATLGDFDLAMKPGDYLDYRRTVDGIQAGYAWRDTRLLAHLAASRGRFHRMEWPAQEGLQGPWQLLSESGSDQILVLAGSESVWLNGELMQRGEDGDYVMDYSLAQLRFTARRPLRAEDRIQVEFQYSERLYQRSLYGLDAASKLPGGINLQLGWVMERDDKDRPLDVYLDEGDRELMAAAGDSGEGELYGSGARQVVPGEGHYRLLDAAAGQWGEYEYLEEIPDSLAESYVWQLRFSQLPRLTSGQMQGDYSRQFTASGRQFYRYEGPGLGDYAPLIPLSAPQSLEVYDARLSGRWAGFTYSLESALSRRDLNLFSGRDDEDNLGAALKGEVAWSSPELGRSFWRGRLGAALRAQSEQQDFQPLKAVDEQEFERIFGISRQGSLKREDISLSWAGQDSLRLEQKLIRIRRDTSTSRTRESRLALAPERGLQLRARLRQRELLGQETASTFDQQVAEPGWRWGSGRAGFSYQFEQLDAGATGDRFRERGLSLSQQLFPGLEARAGVTRRRLDRLSQSIWRENASRDEGRIGLEKSGRLSGEMLWTHRVLDFASADSARQKRDIALVRLQQSGDRLQWNLRYQAEHALSRERVLQFIQVDSLTGSYSRDPFVPDLFVPDPDGDYIAVPWETGEVSQEALLGLALDLRWQGEGPFSGSHRISVEEESRLADAASVFLLKPSALMSDSTTRGRIFSQQDLELREADTGRRWRLRWEEDRNLSRPRWSQARVDQSRKLALRLRVTQDEWRWSLEALYREQLRDLPGSSDGRLEIRAEEALAEISKRLSKGWLIRLKSEVEQARTKDGLYAGLRLFAEPGIEARPGRKGSFQLRASWQDLRSDQTRIPYELLGGARVGRTLRAALDATWQLGPRTRLSASWQMSSLPGRAVLNSANLQVQSFF